MRECTIFRPAVDARNCARKTRRAPLAIGACFGWTLSFRVTWYQRLIKARETALIVHTMQEKAYILWDNRQHLQRDPLSDIPLVSRRWLTKKMQQMRYCICVLQHYLSTCLRHSWLHQCPHWAATTTHFGCIRIGRPYSNSVDTIKRKSRYKRRQTDT